MEQHLRSLARRLIETLPRDAELFVKRLYYYLTDDPEIRILKELCNRQKVSLDIGANTGMYTMFLYELSYRVICFEPNPRLYEYLRDTFGGLRVDVMNCALGRTNEHSQLTIPYVGSLQLHGWASLVSDFRNREWKDRKINRLEKVTVEVRRLDDFQLKNVGFIKVDVEGFESQVLDGAVETLKQNMPNILIEIEQRHNQQDIRNIFRKLLTIGYRGYFLYHRKLRPIDQFDVSRMQDPKKADGRGLYVKNFIFIPSQI